MHSSRKALYVMWKVWWGNPRKLCCQPYCQIVINSTKFSDVTSNHKYQTVLYFGLVGPVGPHDPGTRISKPIPGSPDLPYIQSFPPCHELPPLACWLPHWIMHGTRVPPESKCPRSWDPRPFDYYLYGYSDLSTNLGSHLLRE